MKGRRELLRVGTPIKVDRLVQMLTLATEGEPDAELRHHNGSIIVDVALNRPLDEPLQ
jgi:hypothetical protein